MPSFTPMELLEQAMALVQKAQMHLQGYEVTDEDIEASQSCLHFAYAMLALQGAAMRKEKQYAAER